MKIKPGFEIQKVCGENILIGMGEENIDFSKVISFNETSLFIWEKMEEGASSIDAIVSSLTEEYEVDVELAKKDVTEFVNQLIELGVLEK